MFLKNQEILMEKPHTKNEQEMLMDDPLYTLLKDLMLENPKSLIFSHVNINSLKKEGNDYFKYILNKHFIYILCISESKLNDCIVEIVVQQVVHFRWFMYMDLIRHTTTKIIPFGN